MLTTVADLIKIMGAIAPDNLAEDGDNVGLQVGQMDWPVKIVWIALDPSMDVVVAACQENVDLLITHHPLIFRPLRSVNFDSPAGSAIYMAAQNHLAIFAAHTNIDRAVEGLNDTLARKIGLSKLQSLEKSENTRIHKLDLPNNTTPYGTYPLVRPNNRWGLGRVGELSEPLNLRAFALHIKKILGLESVKVAGDLELPITKAAVCTGSGSGLMKSFFASEAQVFVSGDLRYHDAKEAVAAKRGLIDIGHFASEHFVTEVLAERLSRFLTEEGFNVKVEAYRLEKDPFVSL